ncbi:MULTISPECIES: polyamine aminopropyltransferase [Romboutsia]|uniref:Polyamine aminopropyltransferase n=1 Tax=Romboutsia hominis TaxID=1507512 RepID=A0A2P2BRN8_9FIRM|nr:MULTISPECIES: polyamine aminopropyltransferase [Romboutsia]MCH1960315.1 polyamine aminopropyltransferase [Romboutsia hominis]MCH1969251.1 polyamine aminopropyltransferase [Romboutsia hominis]MDB8791531.1 polyamine aminopropyltransferase [Romboutsia sp. 1001216sp1]MDB8794481.1 polyamine aminopropyltransferase [Romboutsia sp. 1001216sp1]MDB8797487.1 polyamine aminopropyltransferase [Romboutsia sp. 1001216sp1]
MVNNKFNYKILMLTTLIISGCSIVYELLISAVGSYLLGDSIKQFSITIGLYMCAMGVGSHISKYVKKNLFDFFVFVEIAVGILGGISSLILFLSNVYIASSEFIMYIQIVLIGTLVGLEIPILTRIIEENCDNLRVTLSNVFSFDYIGGLIGSLLFPLFLLPTLGYFATSFLVGTINIVIAIVIIHNYKSYIKNIETFKIVSYISLVFMFLGVLYSENISQSIENSLYRDRVVLSNQTQYQKIVMTRHKDDLRLYLNGNIQFSSKDEYRYHEALVHIPMGIVKNHENVLILGGGDGLAVRELLKYDDIKNITLVDIDKEMVDLCKTNPLITEINKNSLSSEKVNLVYEDAFEFLENTKEVYDVIIVDLPDPNNDSLNKLYTNIFYRLCKNALTQNGVMTVQSTSPYYARKAFWSINKTLKSEDFNVYPYHVQVPSFGEWGFNLSSKQELNLDDIKVNVSTKYLNKGSIESMFNFAQDEVIDIESIDTNTLSHPKLINYYEESVKNWK